MYMYSSNEFEQNRVVHPLKSSSLESSNSVKNLHLDIFFVLEVYKRCQKKEKKLENIKQHWLSYPLFICALVEFFWSPENLQFLWFSIFLMCLLVSVCFVWCWIYLWDHLTNNWHFRAYIIKGFCDGWGGGFLYYSHLSFLLSFGIFFLWFI